MSEGRQGEKKATNHLKIIICMYNNRTLLSEVVNIPEEESTSGLT